MKVELYIEEIISLLNMVSDSVRSEKRKLEEDKDDEGLLQEIEHLYSIKRKLQKKVIEFYERIRQESKG